MGRRERELTIKFFSAPFPHVAKREKEGKFDSYENARRCAVEFVLTHATKQEFSVYEQIGKRMNMDFPNIEIQEGECGGGGEMVGEYRNKKCLATPRTTSTTSKYANKEIHDSITEKYISLLPYK